MAKETVITITFHDEDNDSINLILGEIDLLERFIENEFEVTVNERETDT